MTVDQAAFTKALFDPEQPVPEGLIAPNGRPAGKRFDVYRNNVLASLCDALETAFPVIRKLLGDEFFRAMAGVYARQFPPKSPVLMFYGQDMPRFLETFPPVAHLPYLPDVATLELALIFAYHSRDAAPVSVAEIEEIAPEDLFRARFKFAPAATIIASDYPIFDLWHMNMTPGAEKPKPVAQDVLVFRPEFDSDLAVLPKGCYQFLAALWNADPLGGAFEQAQQAWPQFDLSECIGLLLNTKVITEVIVEKG